MSDFRVVPEKASDGSEMFNVVGPVVRLTLVTVPSPTLTVTFACVDEGHANELAERLNACVDVSAEED